MTRADEVWLETLRRLTPERHWEMLKAAWAFGFELRVAGVRARFPGFSDEEARKRAVAEALACHKKNSLRRSPLF